MYKLEGRGLEKWYYYYYYYYYEVSNVYKRGEEQGGEMMRSSVLKDGSKSCEIEWNCKKEGRGI